MGTRRPQSGNGGCRTTKSVASASSRRRKGPGRAAAEMVQPPALSVNDALRRAAGPVRLKATAKLELPEIPKPAKMRLPLSRRLRRHNADTKQSTLDPVPTCSKLMLPGVLTDDRTTPISRRVWPRHRSSHTGRSGHDRAGLPFARSGTRNRGGCARSACKTDPGSPGQNRAFFGRQAGAGAQPAVRGRTPILGSSVHGIDVGQGWHSSWTAF